ncbi:MAG: Asp23/Gls24 family envelope stress response protein [Clostridiales bacterium]|nr:Asp23/Gls24 family envelope stress response protein [Clostridiales bacterium]
MGTIVNKKGTISISNEVIAIIAGHSAEQCYGIVGMASKSATDGISQLLNLENYSKGIKVQSNENEVEIDIFVKVIYGVSINAVAQTAIDTIKYNVEHQTSLKVKKVNVTIDSVKV